MGRNDGTRGSQVEAFLQQNGLMTGGASELLARLASVPKLVRNAAAFIGTVREGIRYAEYNLGPPILYNAAQDIAPEQTTVVSVNVPADGQVRFFFPQMVNVSAAPADVTPQGVVNSVGIGSQSFWLSINGQPIVLEGAFTIPAQQDGFARRIRVREGDTWRISVTNLSPTDDYRFSFFVEQYANFEPNWPGQP